MNTGEVVTRSITHQAAEPQLSSATLRIAHREEDAGRERNSDCYISITKDQEKSSNNRAEKVLTNPLNENAHALHFP